MIEITFDTSRLEAKLLAASRGVQTAIEQGVTRGSEDLSKQIDDFMFVPLAFKLDVEQRNKETTASTVVSLNLPPRRVSRPGQSKARRFNRYEKRSTRHNQKKKPKSSRRWQDYVRQLASQSGKTVVSIAIANEIKRGLR